MPYTRKHICTKCTALNSEDGTPACLLGFQTHIQDGVCKPMEPCPKPLSKKALCELREQEQLPETQIEEDITAPVTSNPTVPIQETELCEAEEICIMEDDDHEFDFLFENAEDDGADQSPSDEDADGLPSMPKEEQEFIFGDDFFSDDDLLNPRPSQDIDLNKQQTEDTLLEPTEEEPTQSTMPANAIGQDVVYLIDSENVGKEWVSLLKADDPSKMYYLFASENSANISIFDLPDVCRVMGEGRIQIIPCIVGTPNAMDFQILFFAGQLSRDMPEKEFYIVSKDHDYDCVIKNEFLINDLILGRTIKPVGAIAQEQPNPEPPAPNQPISLTPQHFQKPLLSTVLQPVTIPVEPVPAPPPIIPPAPKPVATTKKNKAATKKEVKTYRLAWLNSRFKDLGFPDSQCAWAATYTYGLTTNPGIKPKARIECIRKALKKKFGESGEQLFSKKKHDISSLVGGKQDIYPA